MKHAGKITVSRPQYSDGTEVIVITIDDRDAGVRAMQVEIGYAEFAKMLTGQGHMPMEFEVSNLDIVGKKKLRSKLSFKMPEHDYSNRKQIARETANKRLTDGWVSDNYFGSQDSFFIRNDEKWARTSISKWVDKNETG